MINGIGSTPNGRVDGPRTAAVQRGTPVAKPGTVGRDAGAAAPSPAADLAASGPPVDTDKVAAIRAAIAEGRYPIDPQAIADRMVETDLPGGAA